MIFHPHTYQEHGIEHIVDHPASGLFLDMGLGKTGTTLTAIDKLIFDLCEVTKVLVIAPLFVADNVWTAERDKWDHLQHLVISKVLGSEKERKEALKQKADIYVINRENVAWLVAFYGGAWPFDMAVIDESSSFKSAKSARFKALRMVRPKIKRIVALTGTPVPNGLLDLWPQLYLLDQGERLGKTLTSYRERYFTPGKRNGYVVYEYKLKKDDIDILGDDYYQKEIYDKIGDICISMKAEDWLDLPERIDRTIEVKLPADIKKQYDDFERKQVLALDEQEISAVNAAALSNKLLQFANGAIYDSEGDWVEVHKEKLKALEEIIESASGHPVLVAYSYKHDLERMMEYLKAYKPEHVKTKGIIERWNKKQVPLMLAHPASAGHGLNLQAGGNIIVWFGLPNWNLELYQQFNARLHRQGQLEKVIIHHLVTKGTMDEDQLKVLGNKGNVQELLMQAVKARVKKYRQLV